MSLYVKCNRHVIALLYHYAVAIVVEAIVGEMTMMLRLSLPLSDKVKQLQGVCISYNKATTIWLLPVADNCVTKHDHLIQQFI